MVAEVERDKKPAYLPTRYSRWRVVVLSWLGYLLLRGIVRTLRWQVPRTIPQASLTEGPRVFVFWHGRQLIMFDVHRRVFGMAGKTKPPTTLSSGHPDGRIIARIIERCGYCTLTGSTSRGAVRALRALERVLREENSVGLTPDGPKGPNRTIAHLGAIYLSKMTGAPIVAMTLSADRAWVFNSWDKMMLPKPFAKVTYLVDEPLVVPPRATDAEMANLARELQRRLDEITDQADRAMGRIG